jgi:serine/threonine protein kinase
LKAGRFHPCPGSPPALSLPHRFHSFLRLPSPPHPLCPCSQAPEVMEGKPYSFKGDVWALGCVVYELCTLKPAFGASNFPRVALKVLRGG